MESLALAAAVVMLVILSCGAISLGVAMKPPTKLTWKIMVTPWALGAVGLGQWLARLDVGSGARAMGACSLAAGVGALWRTWRAARHV